MGRKRERESGMGLLPRMEARVGVRGTSYRYKTHDGRNIPLGSDRNEAIRKVLDLSGATPDHGTVRWVWEKYRTHPKFLKRAPDTRTDYEQCAVQILAVLGSVPIGSIDANMVSRYIHVERADAPSRANHEKALLSNLFKHGVRLGVCQQNPAREVEPHETEARSEAPDAAILARFLAWVATQTPQRQIVGLAARYASLAGNRKVEFLDLVWPQIGTDEIRVKRAKQRGKNRGEVIEAIAITPELRACLDELQAIKREDCLYVFPTRDNRAYSARGFKTLWQRIVVKAIAEKIIPAEARFTFHDLRAYYTTVHKAKTGALPDLHKNPATTAGIYDRTKVVKRSAL